MAVEFRDTDASLSETLSRLARSIPGESITLRQLLALIGEQGLLLFCIFLSVPFLFPVSIPGVSTVFGLVIVFVGIGITLNRIPWLPSRLMEKEFATHDLIPVMERGARMVSRLDRVLRPRMPMLSSGHINRLNGIAIIVSGLLLMVPLSLLPLSNTLPALAILLLAAAMLQRDGLVIIAGYLCMIGTMIYFGALALFTLLAGHQLNEVLSFAPRLLEI
ncbi:MAG: exopolysaccharide biosynthesis protein [Anaerolineae bacterium]